MNGEIATTHVRLGNLSHSYYEGRKRHCVLSCVDACFSHGETVALRGRSGSGKTTLLNLIGGIDAPDEGEVKIGSSVITAMSERERTLFRRRNIGFVYQSFNLVPTLTAADNVRLVLELNRVGRREASQRIASLLSAVGLADRQDTYPDVLSGGEQQRVAIARALAHRPSLILADEPTGNLDDTTAEGVLTLLNSLLQQQGGTMIVATHSVAVAARCDRVVELRDGRLLQVGKS
ncbi:MAG: ABC transporter ATP-binding protein [Woeseia sp.]